MAAARHSASSQASLAYVWFTVFFFFFLLQMTFVVGVVKQIKESSNGVEVFFKSVGKSYVLHSALLSVVSLRSNIYSLSNPLPISQMCV